MIHLQHDPFHSVIDEICRGGAATATRAIGAAITKHGGEATRIHRAFADILRGTRDMNAGRYEQALRAIIPTLDELERSAYGNRLGWLYSLVGFCVGMMGNPERGLEWTARGVAEVGRNPTSVNDALAYNNHGCLLGMAGDYAGSREVLEHALAINVQERNATNQFVALANIANSFLEQLQESAGLTASAKRALAQHALRYARRAHKVRSSDGVELPQAMMDNLMGQALLHAGNLAEAMAFFALAMESGVDNADVKVNVHIGMGVALQQSGKLDDARKHLHAAEQIASQGQLGQILNRVLSLGIALEAAAGDLAATMAWTQKRCDFLEKHYKQRLRLLASSTELANQVESVSRNAVRYHKEAEALRLKAPDWDDETLRDGVTLGLNRRGMGRMAGHIFAPFRALSVVVLEIENFPAIHEAYGRTTSDLVLQNVARIIRAQLREADQFARTEGAEFQVLLLDTNEHDAWQIAELLRTGIEGGSLVPGHPEVQLSAEIGVCSRTTEKTFEAVLAGADLALDRYRKSGKDLVA